MKEEYMQMAIELGKKGLGRVSPNPPVGAVVVKNGEIIGKGWHQFYGGLHAERMALNECKEDPEGGELYVTLEPCSHFGHTPPCTEIIIEKKIKKVYIGAIDPNPIVSGMGIKILREKGIEVEIGLLEKECRKLAEAFHWFQSTQKPYVALKYAMTADGKIATSTGDSKWISNEESRENVHKLRSVYDGIMVGIGTVLADDPMLTSRIPGGKNPVRIIVDSRMRIPYESKIVETAKDISTILIATEMEYDKAKKDYLEAKGVKVVMTKTRKGRVDIEDMMGKLGEMGIGSILVEGGGDLNFSIIERNSFNKIYCYIAPKILGGNRSRTPIAGEGFDKICEARELTIEDTMLIGQDILAVYENRREMMGCSQV